MIVEFLGNYGGDINKVFELIDVVVKMGVSVIKI